VHAVLTADKQVAEAYAQPAARVATMATKPPVPVPDPVPLAQGKTPGETVHLRTVALMDLVTHLDSPPIGNPGSGRRPGLESRLREELKMTRQFDAAVDVALEIERELRALTPDRPSLRCFIAECLARADATYEEVEAVKDRLAEKLFGLQSGCGTYIRHLTREIASGRLPEPPEKKRIGGLYWNQKDQAVLELGGRAEKLFLLWMVAAELAYQQNPDVFGTVEDLWAHNTVEDFGAHKAKLAELEAKHKELYARFPSTWAHGDLHIGRITSDGAALITFSKAPGEVPVHPPETAGERLVEYLLRKHETEAKAA
jgi:hypothetical protein